MVDTYLQQEKIMFRDRVLHRTYGQDGGLLRNEYRIASKISDEDGCLDNLSRRLAEYNAENAFVGKNSDSRFPKEDLRDYFRDL